jgi:hypothetical protein
MKTMLKNYLPLSAYLLTLAVLIYSLLSHNGIILLIAFAVGTAILYFELFTNSETNERKPIQ